MHFNAVYRYEVATSRGCLRAQNLLGMMYFDGNGVPKLREKAFSMFQEAGRVSLNLYGALSCADFSW